MTVPRIENLRLDYWQTRATSGRLIGLQQMENALAANDGRDPCEVNFIPESAYHTEADRISMRGYHQGKNIFINQQLVASDQPYMAVETLFHEDRHDYQEHVANHPELAEDVQQLRDFQQNTGDGYLSPELHGDDYYLAQPVEMDARTVARQRTEELYTGEFEDDSLYPAHRASMEAEEARTEEFCRDYLGENYAEVARQTAYTRYEAQQAQQQANIAQETESEVHGPLVHAAEDSPPGYEDERVATESHGESLEVETPPEQPEEIAEDARPSEETGESQDYDYGYGL